MDLKIAIFLMI